MQGALRKSIVSSNVMSVLYFNKLKCLQVIRYKRFQISLTIIRFNVFFFQTLQNMLPKYLGGLLKESGYGINRQSNFLMIAKFLRKTRNKPISRETPAKKYSFIYFCTNEIFDRNQQQDIHTFTFVLSKIKQQLVGLQQNKQP